MRTRRPAISCLVFFTLLLAGGCSSRAFESEGSETKPRVAPSTARTELSAPSPDEAVSVVSLREKTVKSTPAGTDKDGKPQFVRQIVNQWVFNYDSSKDSGALICIGDGDHCIELAKLHEQLNRPKNDPAGIRDSGKE